VPNKEFQIEMNTCFDPYCQISYLTVTPRGNFVLAGTKLSGFKKRKFDNSTIQVLWEKKARIHIKLASLVITTTGDLTEIHNIYHTCVRYVMVACQEERNMAPTLRVRIVSPVFPEHQVSSYS